MKLSFKKNKILIVIIGLSLILSLNFFKKDLRSFLYLISSPSQRFLWKAGDRASNFFETIYEIKNLKNRNEELEQKNQKLLAEIVGLKQLKSENETLRKALEIGLKEEFKLIFAEVIFKDASQDSLLLNKGSLDRVSEGMPVITQEKVLLGRVSEVYENFSWLMLISNKKSSFSAKLQDKEVLGIIQGKGGSVLSFERIPQDEEVSGEDIVLTDILGSDFPAGLLVGTVKKIQKSDTKPFQQIEVSPLFELRNIDRCFIVGI